MGSRKDKVIDLSTLDGRELAGLQEQLDAEVQNLTQSAMTLQRAAGGFGKSGRAIEQLAQQKEGQAMLVPVTSSLYVNGTVMNPDKVLVDIGTGYFVESTSEQGVEYCKRKVNFLRDQIQGVYGELKKKREILQKVSAVLQQKTQAAA
jgi:prefoldin alpha subunit